MKTSNTTSNTDRTRLNTPMQFREDTNPFKKDNKEEKMPSSYSGNSEKQGKRRRILKPVYSVRLF